MVQKILLTPEALQDGYEKFADIDVMVAFFYVKVGRLSRPIQLSVSKATSCHPCSYTI